jgi:hypothetical protein
VVQEGVRADPRVFAAGIVAAHVRTTQFFRIE